MYSGRLRGDGERKPPRRFDDDVAATELSFGANGCEAPSHRRESSPSPRPPTPNTRFLNSDKSTSLQSSRTSAVASHKSVGGSRLQIEAKRRMANVKFVRARSPTSSRRHHQPKLLKATPLSSKPPRSSRFEQHSAMAPKRKNDRTETLARHPRAAFPSLGTANSGDDRPATHGIYKLMNERSGPNSKMWLQNKKRMKKRWDPSPFTEHMNEDQRVAYNDLMDEMADSDDETPDPNRFIFTFDTIYPSIQVEIIEQVREEGAAYYNDSSYAVKVLLDLTDKEIKDIEDRAANVEDWEVPPHLQERYSRGEVVDPDEPPPNAVDWAAMYLRQECLPTSLLGRWQAKLAPRPVVDESFAAHNCSATAASAAPKPSTRQNDDADMPTDNVHTRTPQIVSAATPDDEHEYEMIDPDEEARIQNIEHDIFSERERASAARRAASKKSDVSQPTKASTSQAQKKNAMPATRVTMPMPFGTNLPPISHATSNGTLSISSRIASGASIDVQASRPRSNGTISSQTSRTASSGTPCLPTTRFTSGGPPKGSTTRQPSSGAKTVPPLRASIDRQRSAQTAQVTDHRATPVAALRDDNKRTTPAAATKVGSKGAASALSSYVKNTSIDAAPSAVIINTRPTIRTSNATSSRPITVPTGRVINNVPNSIPVTQSASNGTNDRSSFPAPGVGRTPSHTLQVNNDENEIAQISKKAINGLDILSASGAMNKVTNRASMQHVFNNGTNAGPGPQVPGMGETPVTTPPIIDQGITDSSLNHTAWANQTQDISSFPQLDLNLFQTNDSAQQSAISSSGYLFQPDSFSEEQNAQLPTPVTPSLPDFLPVPDFGAAFPMQAPNEQGDFGLGNDFFDLGPTYSEQANMSGCSFCSTLPDAYNMPCYPSLQDPSTNPQAQSPMPIINRPHQPNMVGNPATVEDYTGFVPSRANLEGYVQGLSQSSFPPMQTPGLQPNPQSMQSSYSPVANEYQPVMMPQYYPELFNTAPDPNFSQPDTMYVSGSGSCQSIPQQPHGMQAYPSLVAAVQHSPTKRQPPVAIYSTPKKTPSPPRTQDMPAKAGRSSTKSQTIQRAAGQPPVGMFKATPSPPRAQTTAPAPCVSSPYAPASMYGPVPDRSPPGPYPYMTPSLPTTTPHSANGFALPSSPLSGPRALAPITLSSPADANAALHQLDSAESGSGLNGSPSKRRTQSSRPRAGRRAAQNSAQKAAIRYAINAGIRKATAADKPMVLPPGVELPAMFDNGSAQQMEYSNTYAQQPAQPVDVSEHCRVVLDYMDSVDPLEYFYGGNRGAEFDYSSYGPQIVLPSDRGSSWNDPLTID